MALRMLQAEIGRTEIVRMAETVADAADDRAAADGIVDAVGVADGRVAGAGGIVDAAGLGAEDTNSFATDSRGFTRINQENESMGPRPSRGLSCSRQEFLERVPVSWFPACVEMVELAFREAGVVEDYCGC